MGLLKTDGTKKTKPVVLANEIIDTLDIDGKTLFEVDESNAVGALVDIIIAKSTTNGSDGNPIRNLVLETATRKIAFGLSRGFDDILLEQSLGDCKFYKRRKMLKDDEPNSPSGPFVMVFGKPGGITFVEETSLVGVEAKAGN